MTVYPKDGANSSVADPSENTSSAKTSSRNAYFSPIPRAVWDLRRRKALTPRDVDVLGLLLDYKALGSPVVDPPQDELAARLACSGDTIARSVRRLCRAGLVATERLRDLRGRLGRTLYDLSAVLALMPARAARLRRGQWGRAASQQEEATPQTCGVSESGDSAVVRDNTHRNPPAPTAVVDFVDAVDRETAAALQDAGVFGPRARALVHAYGASRCRAALAAAARVPHFRHSRAAWIVGALTRGWPLGEGGEARPRAHRPYCPPVPVQAKPVPPPDALAALAPDAYAALEQTARAQLWDETLPAWRETLLHGRNLAYVRTRMRRLLAAEGV